MKNTRNDKLRAVILLLITGLLWSFGGVLIKTNGADPFVISSVRGGAAAMVFFIALKGRPRFRFDRLQVLGAIAYAVTLSCAVLAYSLTSAANAILIQYTSPVYAAVLGFFILREKLRWYDFLSIAGVLAGMWLLVSNDFIGNSRLGDALAVFSGLGFASLSVLLRMRKNNSPYETVLLGNLLTFLIGLPFLITTPPAPAALPVLVILGIFQIGVPYLLFAKASKHARAVDMTILPILEPMMSPVWVFLATGEFPGLQAVWGGLILLVIVTMKSFMSAREGTP
jgi:drug/metabolite transporter (DMT)-like permease